MQWRTERSFLSLVFSKLDNHGQNNRPWAPDSLNSHVSDFSLRQCSAPVLQSTPAFTQSYNSACVLAAQLGYTALVWAPQNSTTCLGLSSKCKRVPLKRSHGWAHGMEPPLKSVKGFAIDFTGWKN